ncbi:MAG: hypothetical protein PHR82_08240 [Endomicrobiaceae bacterium]|nr:hypothetical protein [Endomicrobiaceae bacterium]
MARLTDRNFKLGFDDSNELPSYEGIYEALRNRENDAEEIKTWFFTMKQSHRRTSETIGKVVGIVTAKNEDEAANKAWELAGSDFTYALSIEDITDATNSSGYSFVVYKSEIR